MSSIISHAGDFQSDSTLEMLKLLVYISSMIGAKFQYNKTLALLIARIITKESPSKERALIS
jgi:hypothetical protein